MAIWSRRWSVAKGWHIVRERDCIGDTVAAWLAIFQADEPSVQFVASSRRPHIWGAF